MQELYEETGSGVVQVQFISRELVRFALIDNGNSYEVDVDVNGIMYDSRKHWECFYDLVLYLMACRAARNP